MPTDLSPDEQARQFLTALFAPDDIVEMRLIFEGKAPQGHFKTAKEWLLPENLAELHQDNRNGYNIYVGVNPRQAGPDGEVRGREGNIGKVIAIHADVDGTTPEQVLATMQTVGLKPTIMVLSNEQTGGCHPYLKLGRPELVSNKTERDRMKGFNERFIALFKNAGFKADPVQDLPRILRLPGFVNYPNKLKVAAGRTPSPCTLVLADGPLFEGDPDAVLPKMPTKKPAASSPPATKPQVADHAISVAPAPSVTKNNGSTIIQIGAAPMADAARRRMMLDSYTKKLGHAQEGERHKKTFQLASECQQDHGLSHQETIDELRRYNAAYCSPPLDDDELVRQVDCGDKYGRHGKIELTQDRGPVRIRIGSGAKPAEDAKGNNTTGDEPAFQWIPFPTHLLPAPIANYIRGVSDSMQVDEAMVALPAIAVLGAAIGTTRRIRLTNAWGEYSTWWVGIVSDSGSRKTPCLSTVSEHMFDMDAMAKAENEVDLEKWQVGMAKHKCDFRKWETNKQKGMGGEPPQAPERPLCKKRLVSDITIEALGRILSEQEKLGGCRGLLANCDELKALFGSFDAYKKSSGGDLAKWLSLWNSGQLIIDRKGTQDGSERIIIKRASVSVMGGIQQGVLARMFTDENYENGLAARFLLVGPPSIDAMQLVDMPAGISTEYDAILDGLLALDFNHDELGNAKPVELPLSASGRAEFNVFMADLSQRKPCNPAMQSMASKLLGYCARMSLLLHLIRCQVKDASIDSQDTVDASSIKAASQIMFWFLEEGQRMYHLLYKPAENELDTKDLEKFAWTQNGVLTTRDVMRADCGITKEQALLVLEAMANAGLGTISHEARGGHANVAVLRLAASTKPAAPLMKTRKAVECSVVVKETSVEPVLTQTTNRTELTQEKITASPKPTLDEGKTPVPQLPELSKSPIVPSPESAMSPPPSTPPVPPASLTPDKSLPTAEQEEYWGSWEPEPEDDSPPPDF